MTSILLIICLLFSICGSWAQSIKFSTPQWDFGTIAEDGGSVTHEFEFKNISDKAVVITDVRTTCGCTTPKYSKRPLPAGESATLKIEYDPLYRPGSFSRDITIYTSASREPVTIRIVGNATPRKMSLQEEFPYLLGDGVRISDLYAYLQSVAPSTPQQAQFEIINSSQEAKRIEFKISASKSHLTLSAPTHLAAGERAKVNLAYELPRGGDVYGTLSDRVDIYIDGKKSGMNIDTRAYAIEDFSTLSKKGSASGRFSKKIINFGAFNLKTEGRREIFTIENLGTERLYFRGVESPKGVEITSGGRSLTDMSIAPAGRLDVEVTLKRDEVALGALLNYATFIINDPTQPVVRVKIVAEVSR